MVPANDDFQELSGLLFEAKERYRSARATILHTVVGSVAQESKRRFVDWRFKQPGGSGLGILRTEEERRAHGPDVPQDFYLDYEDTEEVVRLWHERPDRWREERRGAEGELLRCVVAAGRRKPLWIYHPPVVAIHVPFVPEVRDPDPDLAFMLDPSEESFYHSVVDDTTIHKTGRRATVAGREAIEVVIRTISWGYPPIIFRDYCSAVPPPPWRRIVRVGRCQFAYAWAGGYRARTDSEAPHIHNLAHGSQRVHLPGDGVNGLRVNRTKVQAKDRAFARCAQPFSVPPCA